MAAITQYQPYGLPGQVRSFVAKVVAVTTLLNYVGATGKAVADYPPAYIADSGDNLLVLDEFEVQGHAWFERISSATIRLSAAGPTDNLDVSGVNTIFVDTGSNNVTLGGTVGGVDGQVLNIIVHDKTNNFTIENEEGTGNQDFFLHAGGDETMTAEYGGWVFINDDGDHWHDASHAKHV